MSDLDVRDRKKGWKEKQIAEYEQRLERKGLLHSCDPTILVKNPETGKYESWGIRNYKCEYLSNLSGNDESKWDRKMVGVLELPFPCGKKICHENVSSVIITWGEKHSSWGYDQATTLHRGLCSIAPKLEEMEELHFAIQTVYYEVPISKKKSDLLFYEGSNLVDKIENIESMVNFHESQVYYYVKKKQCYEHHIRDYSGVDYIVGKGKHTWIKYDFHRSMKLEKIAKEIVEESIKQGYFDFYYFGNLSATDKTVQSYIERNYSPQKIENFFLDDETDNFCLRIDVNDLKLLSLLVRYGSSCYGIYNIPIDAYLPYLPYENENEWFYKNVSEMLFHKEVLINALGVSRYSNEYELMTALESLRSRSCDVQKEVARILLQRLEPGAVKNKRGQYEVPRQLGVPYDVAWSNEWRENARKLYFEEKQFLVDSGKLNIVWKGEYEMYLLVKKLYPDAIYQYHCEWLRRQSLDVYIPSISLGIEYQGIQHYEPIDHFGGEGAFLRRVELDNQKRQLCADNNVKLLEWRYDSPLTTNGLSKQIKALI